MVAPKPPYGSSLLFFWFALGSFFEIIYWLFSLVFSSVYALISLLFSSVLFFKLWLLLAFACLFGRTIAEVVMDVLRLKALPPFELEKGLKVQDAASWAGNGPCKGPEKFRALYWLDNNLIGGKASPMALIDLSYAVWDEATKTLRARADMPGTLFPCHHIANRSKCGAGSGSHECMCAWLKGTSFGMYCDRASCMGVVEMPCRVVGVD